MDLSSPRFCLSAGEALPPALLEAMDRAVGHVEIYGCIQVGGDVPCLCEPIPLETRRLDFGGRSGSGVFDHCACPTDAIGHEAQAVSGRTRSGCSGWRRTASPSQVSGRQDKPPQTFHGRWCCTGDLFRLDGDGYLWFGGRADELLKVSGLWVSPLEVEDCLLEHPAVAEVAVVGVEVEGLMASRAYVVICEENVAGRGVRGGRRKSVEA